MSKWNNPVLAREARLLLRDPKLLQRLFAGWMALAVIILALWPRAGVYSSEAQASRFVFKVFAYGQLALLLLIAPSITAPLITEEKEKERFGMLFASLLTPLDILLGKWLASLLVLGIVLVASLPLLALTLALGGVSFVEILQVYLVLLLTVLEFGCMGLFFSCVRKRTYNALMGSYGWMLVLVALTWLPSYLLGNIPLLATPLVLLRSLSPFSAMMDVVAPEFLILLGRLPEKWRMSELWTPDFLCFAAGAVMFSVLFFLLCWRKVRNLPLGADVTSEVKEEDAKKKKFPYYLFNPDRRRGPFSVWRLVFTKELRCKMFGYLGNLLRGIYIGFSVSIVLVLIVCFNVRALGTDQVRSVAVLFQLVIILLMTPALTSSTVAEEYLSGTLDMLRMTPVSSLQFIMGKFLAGIFYMLILLGSSCPIYFLFLFMELKLQGNPWMVAEIIAIQAAFLVLCATCGVWTSALTLRTQKATGLAYALLILVVGTPFMLPSLLPRGPALEIGMALSPFITCISRASLSTYKELHLLTPNMAWMLGLTLLMASHTFLKVRQLMRQAI